MFSLRLVDEDHDGIGGAIHGEERDQILDDFGVKAKFKMVDESGMEKDIFLRDVVTTLNKDKHQWVFINKAEKQIAVIEAYDSPCG